MTISGLCPACVAFYSVASSEDSVLYGEEKELTQNLNAKVRELFCMGRHAAHLGLQLLGSKNLEIKRGPKREPIWPKGFVGSIAHTEGLAIAAVAKRELVVGLGVDVELCSRDFRMPLEEKVASPLEQKWILEKPEFKRERLLALCSAKEAVFKAFYPLEQVYLNFLDAELKVSQRGFQGVLRKSAGADWPVGFCFDVLQTEWRGYLVSAVTLS